MTARIDRRSQPRFDFGKDAWVNVTRHRSRFRFLGKICETFGPIIDINLGGMAFYYVDCSMRETDCCEVCIEIPEAAVKIDKLQFVTVSDFPVERISSSETLRKRSGKFVGLSNEQKTEIRKLIDQHTRK